MTNLTEINKWLADQCGVELYTAKEINEHGNYWYDGSEHQYEFTIEDPRCREVCRERFRLVTIPCIEYWLCMNGAVGDKDVTEKGKTIAEAETNCLIAIYNSEVEDK
jgi:hypothetical protein